MFDFDPSDDDLAVLTTALQHRLDALLVTGPLSATAFAAALADPQRTTALLRRTGLAPDEQDQILTTLMERMWDVPDRSVRRLTTEALVAASARGWLRTRPAHRSRLEDWAAGRDVPFTDPNDHGDVNVDPRLASARILLADLALDESVLRALAVSLAATSTLTAFAIAAHPAATERTWIAILHHRPKPVSAQDCVQWTRITAAWRSVEVRRFLAPTVRHTKTPALLRTLALHGPPAEFVADLDRLFTLASTNGPAAAGTVVEVLDRAEPEQIAAIPRAFWDRLTRASHEGIRTAVMGAMSRVPTHQLRRRR